jgi:peptide deformylase
MILIDEFNAVDLSLEGVSKMAVLEIVKVPNEVLRRKARPVSDFGLELQELIDNMVETLRDAPGVGLAAPQVDVSLRVIVVEYGDEENEDVPPKLYMVVNPEIQRTSREMIEGTEACLSIPGLAGEVNRYEGITVKGLSRRGQPVKIKCHGWLARIFQHEIDHLNGVLFTDLTDKVFKLEDLNQESVILD